MCCTCGMRNLPLDALFRALPKPARKPCGQSLNSAWQVRSRAHAIYRNNAFLKPKGRKPAGIDHRSTLALALATATPPPNSERATTILGPGATMLLTPQASKGRKSTAPKSTTASSPSRKT